MIIGRVKGNKGVNSQLIGVKGVLGKGIHSVCQR